MYCNKTKLKTSLLTEMEDISQSRDYALTYAVVLETGTGVLLLADIQ